MDCETAPEIGKREMNALIFLRAFNCLSEMDKAIVRELIASDRVVTDQDEPGFLVVTE